MSPEKLKKSRMGYKAIRKPINHIILLLFTISQLENNLRENHDVNGDIQSSS